MPVALRKPDDNPENACTGDYSCNGRGDCEPRAQVVAGEYRTCVLSPDGKVRCWGHLGGTVVVGDDETPLSVGEVDAGGTVVELAAGSPHSCALLAAGNVRCWGRGGAWLGYGKADVHVEVPADAGDVDIGGEVVHLAAGRYHACAVLTNGKMRCWGDNSSGRVGYPAAWQVGYNDVPADVGDVELGDLVLDVTAGWHDTCVLLVDGNVRCWGAGGPRLGGSSLDGESPASAMNVKFVNGNAVQIAAGTDHTCALLSDGSVRCWGRNDDGQVGYPGSSSSEGHELDSVQVGGTVEEIATGNRHTCARLSGGAVRCWGSNEYGQLGYGNIANVGDDETPASAGDVDLGGVAIGITAGWSHTCALLSDLNVRCWGSAKSGQLGYGNTANIGDDETPASAGNVLYR